MIYALLRKCLGQEKLLRGNLKTFGTHNSLLITRFISKKTNKTKNIYLKNKTKHIITINLDLKGIQKPNREKGVLRVYQYSVVVFLFSAGSNPGGLEVWGSGGLGSWLQSEIQGQSLESLQCFSLLYDIDTGREFHIGLRGISLVVKTSK